MVSFPWKQKIERSGIPSSSARQKKSGQPLDKKLMIRKSSDSFLISNKKSKPSSEAVQENYRHSRRGSVLVCTPFLANHALLCLKFPQTRKPENLSTIFQENRRPWRRFVLPAKTKHVAVSCSGPQRGQRVGKARHFLSIGQPLSSEFPASNERTNTTTQAGRRGC